MSPERASTNQSVNKVDILVVDANPDNQYLLSVLLIGQGYQVRKATNSESAFAAMGTKLPDSIVLNVALPGTNGYEICQMLKAAPDTRKIPIVFAIDSPEHLDKNKIFEVGGADYLVAPYESKEAISRISTQLQLRELQLQVAKQQATIEQVNQQLQHLTQLDGLTQVANRRQFDKHLTQEWRRLKRDRQPLSLVLCDIDYFKRYNDTYGHQAGDNCLQAVANAIRATAKRPADFVARYGPKKFAAILPNTNLEGAVQVAELIRLQVKRLKIVHQQPGTSEYITLSSGISTHVPSSDFSPGALIAAAEEALVEAKEQGRDRCCVTDS
ncbi:MAG: diguanylate cyclase [Cyanobacteriota bacterium]|nr:diguanylate cyclase [Cyanobacteriota bacterium]